jgi:signal peptidase I
MEAGGQSRPQRPLSSHEPPRPDLEPIKWEDEDALFAAPSADGEVGDGWTVEDDEAARVRDEQAEMERIRIEHARRSRNPLVRWTAPLPHWARVTIDWTVTIVGAIAIVLAIKAWVVNPYRIPSSSMEPTLHCARPGSGCESRFSDRVLANRFIYHFRKPKRGDIIVFETPPAAQAKCGARGTFVKRLIALPGETWEQRDGAIYINGKKLVEPYVHPGRRDTLSYPARKIPPGRYFFMGDNRSQSCDSREWGAVPRKNIIGEVFFVYWPPNRIGFRAALVLLGFVLVFPLTTTGRRRWRRGSRRSHRV